MKVTDIFNNDSDIFNLTLFNNESDMTTSFGITCLSF